MDFGKEVDFRLSKLILSNLYHDGVLTEKKRDRLWQALLDRYAPPFKGIEDVGEGIGEGFRIGDINTIRSREAAVRKAAKKKQDTQVADDGGNADAQTEDKEQEGRDGR